ANLCQISLRPRGRIPVAGRREQDRGKARLALPPQRRRKPLFAAAFFIHPFSNSSTHTTRALRQIMRYASKLT
ncbi:MAG: hypothetical protein AB8B81_16225, partial [Halioglobus sp.]